jgi:hypothetical protein
VEQNGDIKRTRDTNLRDDQARRPDALQALLSSIVTLLKIVAIIGALAWVVWNHRFIETWLWSLSGGELAGFKFQRTVIDEATRSLTALSDTVADCTAEENKVCFDKVLGEAALKRASRVAPAIVDALILWVDDNNSNYTRENSLIVDFAKTNGNAC